MAAPDGDDVFEHAERHELVTGGLVFDQQVDVGRMAVDPGAEEHVAVAGPQLGGDETPRLQLESGQSMREVISTGSTARNSLAAFSGRAMTCRK